MRAIVIYDSLYGNTAKIARAIGAALPGDFSPEVHSIGEATLLPEHLDLLIVGGPTQGHGVDTALKEYLDELPDDLLDGMAVAVFDTRLHWPELLSGSAAKGIASRLESKGAHLIAGPESFFVEGKEGPLAEGELERATAWARQLRVNLVAKA